MILIKRAAVIGHPIGHSLSPRIFAYLSGELGQESSGGVLEYTAVDVEPKGLKSFLERMRSEDRWVGCNITIPHKESVFDWIDDVAPAAREVGAVNVLEVRDHKLVGHNTDVLGIQESIKKKSAPVQGGKVLILGTGGAARASAYAFAKAGAGEIFIQGRNAGRAADLAEAFTKLFAHIVFRSGASLAGARLADVDWIVQATPVGMFHHAGGSDPESGRVFQEALRTAHQKAVAFDLIYRPAMTPFLSEAKKMGLQTLGGLSMLIEQALATWEIWLFPLGERKRELRTGLKHLLTSPETSGDVK